MKSPSARTSDETTLPKIFSGTCRRSLPPRTVPRRTAPVATATSGHIPENLAPLRRQVDGHPRAVDEESDGRRRGDEGFLRDVEPEHRRGADPALIPDEAAEEARDAARE